MRRRAIALFFALFVLSSRRVSAQQRGSDVGGQPARRKLTKMPLLTKFVEAEYPAPRRAAGTTASVVLVIEISATGQVTAVSVVASGGADFDAAAIDAARQFRFEPAEVDNRPAPAKVTYRYDFTLTAAPVLAEPPPGPAVNAVTASTPAPEVDTGATRHASRTDAGAPAPPSAPSPRSNTTEAAVAQVEIRGRPRARHEVVQTTVSVAQARKIAGTQGDVLKVVQNLPGVSRPPLASGQIVVWGSAPKDTRVYVDGVDLPALYHGSGLRGTINSDLVSSVDLVPGAFGAEYGRGLGGLVRVETRALPRGTHGYVGADTLDGSALVSTELGERVRIATALRYGWLDRVLAASAPDIGDAFPIPRYRDGQVKVTIDLRARESVDLVLLASTDDLDRTVPSADPVKTRTESSSTGFWRGYARYTNVSQRGDVAVLTPFVGQDRSSLAQRFGGTPARLDVTSTRYGLRGSLRSAVGSYVHVVAGVDALGTSSNLRREGSLTLPAREGDVGVFGQPPGDEVAADTWSTTVVDVAPHVYADVRLGPLTLTPGARVDAFLIEGSRRTPRVGPAPPIGFSRLETTVAPRVSGRWDVTARLAFTAAYGTYHQPPEPEDLSAVFGTPDLGISRATHVSAGESLKITRTLSVDVVGFHKTMHDLVVRSRLTNPILARALTQNGEGRSYGVQFLLRQELARGFFGWISYTISKSERRYEGDATYRAFDFDQPHVLSAVVFQELGRWGFGARFRYATGNPRTPVTGGVFDARDDRYDPVFGAQNTSRVPAFWQLDLRVERTFMLGKSVRLLLFADVQNVTNRANAEEVVYSSDFRQQGRIRGLPALAIVGARLEL